MFTAFEWNDFLCCTEFDKTTTWKDVYDKMDTYFKSVGLSWALCEGVRTDGEPSFMVGCLKGLYRTLKDKMKISY